MGGGWPAFLVHSHRVDAEHFCRVDDFDHQARPAAQRHGPRGGVLLGHGRGGVRRARTRADHPAHPRGFEEAPDGPRLRPPGRIHDIDGLARGAGRKGRELVGPLAGAQVVPLERGRPRAPPRYGKLDPVVAEQLTAGAGGLLGGGVPAQRPAHQSAHGRRVRVFVGGAFRQPVDEDPTLDAAVGRGLLGPVYREGCH
eukprot:scaffold12990_cov99-Isochrysis_galbana.AAC.8